MADSGVGDGGVDLCYVVLGLRSLFAVVVSECSDISISSMTKVPDAPMARRVRASMLACEGVRTTAIIS